jgi:tRNA (cytidine/uridine-2'-O-)-methyltransferase
MDYWEHVTWKYWNSFAELQTAAPPGARWHFIETGAPRLYTAVQYRPDDYLVFGRETAGLPATLREAHRDELVSIPMFNPQARSLNLSNCVAIVLYEAIRQTSAS